MYRLIQFVRHKIPFVWNLIDRLNATLFRLKFRQLNKCVEQNCIKYSDSDFAYSVVKKKDLEELVSFFKSQPTESFEFFNPHKFDFKTLEQLSVTPSFIMLLAKTDGKIVGYSFIRAFFTGKAFRGKIVDINYRGRGIAKVFGKLTMDISTDIGLNLFGTISKRNLSSMASSKSANDIRIIEELPDDYMLIQYLPKQ